MLGFSLWLSQTGERELPRSALFSFLPSEQTPKGVRSLELMLSVAAVGKQKCQSLLMTDGSNGLGSKKKKCYFMDQQHKKPNNFN